MAIISKTTLAVTFAFDSDVVVWDLSTGRFRGTLDVTHQMEDMIYLIAPQADGSVAFAAESEIWTGRLENWEGTRRMQRVWREDAEVYLVAADGAYITSEFSPGEYEVQVRGETIGRFSPPDSFRSMFHTTHIRIQSDRIVGWASDDEMGCYLLTHETPAELPREASEAASEAAAAGGAPAGVGRTNVDPVGRGAAGSEHCGKGRRPPGM